MTLHEAISSVLIQAGKPLKTAQIASEVNKLGLFHRSDGNPVPPAQIHARISKYPKLFKRDEKGSIYLLNKLSDELTEFNKLMEASGAEFHLNVKKAASLGLRYEFESKTFERFTRNLLNRLTDYFYASVGIREPQLHVIALLLYNSIKWASKKTDFYSTLPELKEWTEKVKVDSEEDKVDDLILVLESVGKILEWNDELKILNELKNAEAKELRSAYLKCLRLLKFSAPILEKGASLFPIAFNSYLDNYLKQSGKRQLQFVTPDIINRLLISLVDLKDGQTVYDPAIGVGTTFTKIYPIQNNLLNCKFLGQEFIKEVAFLCQANMFLNFLTGRAKIEIGDSLTHPAFPKEVADLAISNPPFNVRLDPRQTNEIVNAGYLTYGKSDSTGYFIQLMLSRVKQEGRVFCIVPEGFLFNQQSKLLRTGLIDDDIVESIIALPSRIYLPYAALNTSVLVLNKAKAQKRKGAIQFIDARNVLGSALKQGQLKFSDKEANFFVKNIAKAYQDNETSKTEKINAFHVLNSKIINNEYDLSPFRYTHPVFSAISKTREKGVDFTKLTDILGSPKTSSVKDDDIHLPYIRIRDLKKEGGEIFYSQIRHVGTPSEKQIKQGRLLYESALLIAKVGSDLKPTILILKEEEKAIINNNIYVFKIDGDKINNEYLVGQLNTELVKEQADFYRTKVVMESLGRDNFLKIEIPLPTLSEQLEWVAKNIRRIAETGELASFIKSIPLIESSEDLKKEIERFTKAQFNNAPSARYNDYFWYNKYPFSSSEMINFVRAKKLGKYTTLIALQNDEYGYFGVVEVDDENPIDFSKVQTINEYASFLRKIYDFLTKSSINRQLDAFAHTSKNFFYKLQGEVSQLLGSKNKEFQKILDSIYVESQNVIAHFEKKGKPKDDFLLKNQLTSISQQISAQYNFYSQIHELYTEIKNAQISHFELPELIEELDQFDKQLKYEAIPNYLVFGKRALLKHALLDLIGNAIKYSSDGICKLEVIDKGNWFAVVLSNSVDELLNEEKYNKLGQTWLKDNSAGQDRISSGIYYAFQMIRESLGEVSLDSYDFHSASKIFRLFIQLRKNE